MNPNADRLLRRQGNGGSRPGLPVRGQAWQRSLVMYRIGGPLSTTMTIASRPKGDGGHCTQKGRWRTLFGKPAARKLPFGRRVHRFASYSFPSARLPNFTDFLYLDRFQK